MKKVIGLILLAALVCVSSVGCGDGGAGGSSAAESALSGDIAGESSVEESSATDSSVVESSVTESSLTESEAESVADESEPFIGTGGDLTGSWSFDYFTDDPGIPYVWNFFGDGTGSIVFENATIAMTYFVDGASVSMTYAGETFDGQYSVLGDTLVIVMDEGQERVSFTRNDELSEVSEPLPVMDGMDAELLGSWSYDLEAEGSFQSYVWVFNPDGTGTVTADGITVKITYSLDGDGITLLMGEDSITGKYAVSGDTLTIESDGTTQVYKRL